MAEKDVKKRKNYDTGFYVKLSEADKKQLEKKAEQFYGGNRSHYLRAMLYNRPIDDLEMKKILTDLIREVNKIGVNINQITKDYNAFLITGEQVAHLEFYLKQILGEMEKVRKKLYQAR